MASQIPKTRKPRNDSIYSKEEIQVINIHKEEYKQQTTEKSRAKMMKTKILPELFNYWFDRGKRPKTAEESADWIKVSLINDTQTLHFIALCSATCFLGTKQLASLLVGLGPESESQGQYDKCGM